MIIRRTSRHNRSALFALLSIFTFSSLIPTASVFAIDEGFYSGNNILFYNPDETCTVAVTAAATTGSVGLEKSVKLEQIFQLLINGGMNAGQAAAVMGNMYAESGFNSDITEKGNSIGYGLAQWSFSRRTNLENFAKEKGIPVSDIPLQIEFLLREYNGSYKSRLDKTVFKEGTDVAASTKAWMEIFEAPALKPANDPAALNSKRIPAAVTIFGLYQGLSQVTTVASTTSCGSSSGNSAVAGDIVKTAIGYALQKPATDTMTSKSDARDTYQTAKMQYNPSVDWTDCGGFIATVMIASGVDPNYTKVSVAAQLKYVKSNPDKYLVITSPKVSDLQPGDILLSESAGHTTMYTGETQYSSVDASLGQRVPSVRNASSHIWMLNNGSVIARVIK